MSNIPQISGSEAVKAFMKDGWAVVRTVGSHVTLKKPGVRAILTVPQHKTLKKGTLSSLIKDSGLSVDEFKAFL